MKVSPVSGSVPLSCWIWGGDVLVFKKKGEREGGKGNEPF